MFKKHDEPVVGVPYFVGVNPYQASVIYGDPKGIPIHQTMYRDTPAPFNCPYCGNSGLTMVRYILFVYDPKGKSRFPFYILGFF